MSAPSIHLAATGDSFITRRLPPNDPEAARLAALMASADVRYTNLEVVIRRNEGFPAAQSGGTWAATGPEALDDLRSYGFNLLSWANNHTLDYSHGGLEATKKYLDQANWIHCGAGPDLPRAAAPCYVETAHGRVACLAASSSFHESWPAGNPRPGMPGRPGLNPLRYHTHYRVSRERFHLLAEIANHSGVNAAHNLKVKEGFANPDPSGTVRLGKVFFQCADDGSPNEGPVTRLHEGDLQRMLMGIADARAQADCVLVAIHCHEMKLDRKDQAADFLQDFAHACIDGGADAVIGHGPHILRGVELYKCRPIFYSLGNFIFQNETVACLPADFYEAYSVPLDASTTTALNIRSRNGKAGLALNPDVWQSVVARWSFSSGALRSMEFHPVSLGHGLPRHHRGWPSLTGDISALENLVALSAELGTPLRIDGGKAVWQAN